MTTRDRLALIGISSLAVLAFVWLLLVSPERKQASSVAAQVTQANAQLASADSDAAAAQAAQSRYSAAYTSVVALGKAVPPSEEVPSLIYQLAQASSERNVEFSSITNSSASSSSGSSSGTSSASTAASAFTQMPFTFVFNGSFSDLYHLFVQLDGATVRTASGGVQVSGRLLTLQGVKLEPAAGAQGGKLLTGTITATAYVLPSGTGLTGGATASTPAASVAGSAATSASTGSSAARSGTSAPAAVVTAGPAQ